MAQKIDLERRLLIEFTKASKEARGKKANVNCGIFLIEILFPELYLGGSIAETFEIPKSINFLRNHVSKNLPLVIRGAMSQTPAVKKWNSNYFR